MFVLKQEQNPRGPYSQSRGEACNPGEKPVSQHERCSPRIRLLCVNIAPSIKLEAHAIPRGAIMELEDQTERHI